jgi:hypothetical protein
MLSMVTSHSTDVDVNEINGASRIGVERLTLKVDFTDADEPHAWTERRVVPHGQRLVDLSVDDAIWDFCHDHSLMSENESALTITHGLALRALGYLHTNTVA